MAKELRQRPSKLLGVKNPYAAYCLDEAIMVGGILIQQELEKVTHKKANIQAAKRQARLAKLLGLPDKVRFRDPLAQKG